MEIDEALVRSILREQHPDLAALDLRAPTRGWDNELWRLGDALAVRLPRTPRAPDLLRKEHRWLPGLAARLPLPVPTPVRFGEPSARFPMPWTVAAWVPGEPADRVPLAEGRGAADRLAGFLRALHRDAPADAPVNPERGVPLARLTDGFDEGLRAAADHGLPGGAREVRDVWDEAVSAPEAKGPPVWLHADLHPANVVVADGTLAGVIDFGELCAGDPAVDLAAAWLLLPSGAHTRFFDAYGDVDDAAIRRARGWAVRAALGLLAIGRAGERGLPGGKPTWGPAGRAAIERVLASR
ncbi:aminoglycoside phosphotransferase family protein [Streptomyces radicis]|uniref:Aminoglycoside phosphotransferase family protein n=1 Tax=Streptomyces radicis TaxID=1750517 RepID=A0A3A9W6G0_9ACTN|nr:aminoglycoside phosphotransferase family protein [Streptomyces radicis]RKN08399.1 aminoglycoside phosphotransferase family protein [Streptomyces radicis]RKN21566.1 aminoglycoside phosphotransferase family protein [Streptomyces radicis]